MNKKKRCIFHIPNYIDIQRKTASNIRPLKMISAFEENGYIVDVVMGYTKERKKIIKKIKENIKNGVKYDFLYSESSTMPTLLTNENHLPTSPFLDFSFFSFCRKYGIKIGLFYRDIHWKFEKYNKMVTTLKRIIATFFYKYDLFKYRKLLNNLYLPSKEMIKYLPRKNVINCRYTIDELPPGCDIVNDIKKKTKDNKLTIFYVGGIDDEVYNFKKVLQVVSELNDVEFIICCRKSDWTLAKKSYIKYVKKNIKIIHIGSEELVKYYNEADVCSLLFKNNEYMNMSMPMKLFEYLSYNKPIIATEGTISGSFVKKNRIGWTIKYNNNDILDLIKYLKNNKVEIEKIKKIQLEVMKKNTWLERANKVITNLNERS